MEATVCNLDDMPIVAKDYDRNAENIIGELTQLEQKDQEQLVDHLFNDNS